MMNVESLRTLSTIFYTLAGVFLVTSVVLFFALGIPKAFGIYTGLSALRGVKKYQDKIQQETVVKQTGRVNMTTGSLAKTENFKTSKILSDSDSENENHTMILNENQLSEIIDEPALPVENENAVFTVIQELSFTSSTEIIE